MKKAYAFLAALFFVLITADASRAMCFYNKTSEEIHISFSEPHESFLFRHWSIGPNDDKCTRGTPINFIVGQGYYPLFGKCYIPKGDCKHNETQHVDAHGWANVCDTGNDSWTVYDRDNKIEAKGSGPACP